MLLKKVGGPHDVIPGKQYPSNMFCPAGRLINTTGYAITVVDEMSAQQGIDMIVEQGEGSTNKEEELFSNEEALTAVYQKLKKTNDWESTDDIFSHYLILKMLEVSFDDYKDLIDPDIPSFPFTPPDEECERLLKLFNGCYYLMLYSLKRIYETIDPIQKKKLVLGGLMVSMKNLLTPLAYIIMDRKCIPDFSVTEYLGHDMTKVKPKLVHLCEKLSESIIEDVRFDIVVATINSISLQLFSYK